jgi:hypothetical protein
MGKGTEKVMTRDRRNTAIYTAYDDSDSAELPVPERGLLRAILLNAIADVNRKDEHSRRAREYFLSKEDDYIFSFQAICSYLNIDPRNILILVGMEPNPRVKVGTEAAPLEQEELAASLIEAAGQTDTGLS